MRNPCWISSRRSSRTRRRRCWCNQLIVRPDDVTNFAQAAAMLSPAFARNGLMPNQRKISRAGSQSYARSANSFWVEAREGVPVLPAHCGKIHQQRQELFDVWRVRAGKLDFQRHAMTIDDQVVLAAQFPAIGRVWASLFASANRPHRAAIYSRSRPVILSAARSSASSNSCNRSQTPAACQSRSRRQQVIPQPQCISCGKSSQGIPVLRTNRIPVSAPDH